MPVSTPTQPDYTGGDATVYKTSLDDGFAVAKRLAWAFAPHEQTTPDMTLRLEAGALFDGTTLTEVAAQSTGTITAPSSDPRIDRVVIDRGTGAVSVIAGAEDAAPTPPAIGAGKAPIAQVALVVSQSSIGNADITDERDLFLLGAHGIAGDGLEADANQQLRLNAPHERKTDDYTALVTDRARLIEMDKATAVTLNFNSAVTLGEGWFVYVHNSGAGTLTLDPNGAETIDDVATIALGQNQSTIVFSDGAALWTVGRTSPKGLVLLATASASNSASIDFENGELSAAYDEYILKITNLVPATEGVLWLRTSTDGGASYDVVAGNYRWVVRSHDASGNAQSSQSNTDTEIQLTAAQAVGNAAGESLSLTLHISGPANAARFCLIYWSGIHNDTTGDVQFFRGAAHRNNAIDVDAIRILMASGNITSGEFALYGVSKT